MICPNPTCRREIPPNAEFCPYCGYSLLSIRPQPRNNSPIIIGCIIAIALVLIAGIVCFTYAQTHPGTPQEQLSASTEQSIADDAGQNNQAQTEETQDTTQTVAPVHDQQTEPETVNHYYYYYTGSTPQQTPDDYYSNAGASTYLWPTDARQITISDLSSMNQDTIAAIRNEIYARHGYSFTTERWQTYFSNKTWYHRNSNVTSDTVNNYLSSLEKKNIATITSYEEARGWR